MIVTVVIEFFRCKSFLFWFSVFSKKKQSNDFIAFKLYLNAFVINERNDVKVTWFVCLYSFP